MGKPTIHSPSEHLRVPFKFMMQPVHTVALDVSDFDLSTISECMRSHQIYTVRKIVLLPITTALRKHVSSSMSEKGLLAKDNISPGTGVYFNTYQYYAALVLIRILYFLAACSAK